MHTPLTDSSLPDFSSVPVRSTVAPEETAALTEAASIPSQGHPVVFHGAYVGHMEMMATQQQVAGYLDAHPDWFRRCSQPMTADPIGDNGYALTIGRFGAMGYDVEPRIGLHLLPQDQGVYRIETIPVPDYTPQGYEVDFRAALELKECPSEEMESGVATYVEWVLDLDVSVHFPRFIRALPAALIQKTGDHLLSQVVRQVSRCLTHKVQEDFHSTLNLPLPASYRDRHHHFLERFSKGLHLG